MNVRKQLLVHKTLGHNKPAPLTRFYEVNFDSLSLIFYWQPFIERRIRFDELSLERLWELPLLFLTRFLRKILLKIFGSVLYFSKCEMQKEYLILWVKFCKEELRKSDSLLPIFVVTHVSYCKGIKLVWSIKLNSNKPIFSHGYQLFTHINMEGIKRNQSHRKRSVHS